MKRLLALLTALCLLSACGAKAEPTAPLIYYAAQSAPEGTSALQSEAWTEAPETLTPDLLFHRMQEVPVDPEWTVLFPENTSLLSYELADGLLTLDFSEAYNSLSGIALTQANYALVLTMSQLANVEQISITVQGRPLPGLGADRLSASDLLLTGEVSDPIVLGFLLTFPSAQENGQPVTQYQQAQFYDTGVQQQAAAVIQLLTAGSSNEDARNPYTQPDTVPTCLVTDGICQLTLDEGWSQLLFEDVPARDALVASLCSVPGIEGVSFLWQGEYEDSLSGIFSAITE